jgi:hypothetical protein
LAAVSRPRCSPRAGNGCITPHQGAPTSPQYQDCAVVAATAKRPFQGNTSAPCVQPLVTRIFTDGGTYMGTGTDVWWEELCRATAHHPHLPVYCVSIASSSPISLWLCPNCYRTQLALREHPPECTGGYPGVDGNGTPAPQPRDIMGAFGTRDETLGSIPALRRYSRETATTEAYEYHREWISTHTQV